MTKIKIHPRPYISTSPMRISVKSDHARLKWVIQWKPYGYSKWFTETFDSFCDFISRVSWFRFHNFKIRTFERYSILKSIDL